MVFVAVDIETAVLRLSQGTDLNVACCRLMLVEHYCGKEVRYMPDMEKVEKLTSILEERSGLGVREALVHFYNYLSSEETRIFDKETDYLLDTLGVEIELPF